MNTPLGNLEKDASQREPSSTGDSNIAIKPSNNTSQSAMKKASVRNESKDIISRKIACRWSSSAVERKIKNASRAISDEGIFAGLFNIHI